MDEAIYRNILDIQREVSRIESMTLNAMTYEKGQMEKQIKVLRKQEKKLRKKIR